jgi:hypothetical protein
LPSEIHTPQAAPPKVLDTVEKLWRYCREPEDEWFRFVGITIQSRICAPFGSTGGAAVHLRLSGCLVTCWSSAIAATGSGTAIAYPAIKPNLFMKTVSSTWIFAPPLFV